MAEPLLSEDTDLARLITNIRAEHGDAATIIYHDTVRRGGVAGFFAREVHRVAYRLAERDDVDATDSDLSITELDLDDASTADLSTAADVTAADFRAADVDDAESPSETDDATEDATDGETDTPEVSPPDAASLAAASKFEAILAKVARESLGLSAAYSVDSPSGSIDLTDSTDKIAVAVAAGVAAKVADPVFPAATVTTEDDSPLAIDELLAAADEAERGSNVTLANTSTSTITIASALRVPAETTGTDVAPEATVTPISGSTARGRLDVLMQLRSLGVPVAVNPRNEAHDIYQALEEVLAEVGEAPPVPRAAGEIIALVGPLTPALRAAHDLAAQLRIPRTGIRFAGLAGHPVESLMAGSDAVPVITGAQEARLLRSDLRTSGLVSIVVIATDSTEGDPTDYWASDILSALQPTAAWAVVDATAKLDDERERLERLGGIDALVVHSASLSSSPATVWDLGLPIAQVDGRPATAFTWSSLLFGVLTVAPRHRASA